MRVFTSLHASSAVLLELCTRVISRLANIKLALCASNLSKIKKNLSLSNSSQDCLKIIELLREKNCTNIENRKSL